jgi:predicted metalloendopeptidase
MRTSLRRLSLSSIPTLLVLACGGAGEVAPLPVTPTHAPTPTASAASLPAPVTPGEIGVDLSALDRSADPCADFYQYACGTWLKTTPIPEDQPAWSRSFNVIQERNEKLLDGYLRKDAESPGDEPYAKALGDFYATCMDEPAIEKEGTKPLAPLLAKIAQVVDAASLEQALAALHAIGAHPLFVYDSEQDFGDATQMIAVLAQAGLGLPDREYYLSEEPKMKDVRAAYEAHVEAMFLLAGDSGAQAQKARQAVMRIETALAKASLPRVDLRDPKKIYHRMDLAGVKQAAPEFPWDAYVKDAGPAAVVGGSPINLAEPDFFKAAAAMVKGMPMPEWRAYLKWHLLHYAAPRLSSKFVDEDFAFRRALTGAAKLLPRWKRCVRVIDAQMGEALDRPFVAETIGEEGRAATRVLVRSVEEAMRADLEGLAWMDDATRRRALEKLDHVANKIAYPDKWRSYDTLKIDRAGFLANVMRGDAFNVRRELDKIGKPVDKGEFQMSPATVNAYYEKSLNEMVFLAGILQPPFYSSKATFAVNDGGIGMVMGHELTHGFDDKGRKFDAYGNLSDWWTPKVAEEFERRAKCVADQFDAYEPVPGLKINGKLTLGENIADLGGIKLSFAAMKRARQGYPISEKDGFTDDQQFFLGFAQGWCTNMREEMLRLRVATDTHSPPRFRVIGPLSNFPPFAAAFACKEGQPMVRPPSQRCEVW